MFIFSTFIKSDRKRGREKQNYVYVAKLLIAYVDVYTIKYTYI